MKKLLLALMAVSALATTASADMFNVYNHTDAIVTYRYTDESGQEVSSYINRKSEASGLYSGLIYTGVVYAGYGENTHGTGNKNNDTCTWDIHYWQQAPGYFAITVDKQGC